MQGASPFDLSEGKSSPSRQLLPSNSRTNLSPRLPQPHTEQLPTQMQYRLQKVFEEARLRQEHYISVIKEQEAKRKEQAEHYLKTLKEIKHEFMDYMQLKKGKKEKQWILNLEPNKFESKKQLTRLNSQEFTIKNGRQLSTKASTENAKLEPLLHCQLTFYYYTPHLQDYIRQILPKDMYLILRSTHTGKQFVQEMKIIKDEDEVSNLNYLAERIPFEIATPENRAIVMEFQIPCEQEAINFYKSRQFQLEIVNKEGMFTYAYSKLSLHSLLYFQEQPTEWKLQPTDFYSPLDGHKLGTMSLKVSNQLKMIDRQQHYKIQSNTPMQVNDYKSYVNYNDDESRMIHKISKFKTAHNSLLLGIGSTNSGNAQRYFQSQNDKIVLMHKKKKQLQSIQQYKNSHKDQLMSKLFTDAINRYYLMECQIGQPKFVMFQHRNGQKQHRKVHYRTSLTVVGGEKNNVELAAIEELIGVRLVRPEDFGTLVRMNVVQIGSEMHYEYNMDEEEQAIWTMSGMSHPLIVKILCYPPKQSQLTKTNLNTTYQLTLTLKDEYDRQLQSLSQKFKLVPPNTEHKLYFHGYLHTQTQFEIPFDEASDTVEPKTMLSNQHDLSYSWDQQYTTLSVKIKHTQLGEKAFYILVNNINNLYQINCYQIVVVSYPKLSHEIRLALGEVEKLKLDFTFNQQTLTKKYQNTLAVNQKSKKAREQARVLFASSKPEHCFVKCQNETELLCKLNKTYQLQARIQSYSQELDPERILIHAVDLDSQAILKRWLIEVHKQKVQYQQVHKLVCQHGKPLKYRFEFHNPDTVEHTFRFYSSNMSILTVPMDVVALISNQVAKIDIQIQVKHQLTNQELMLPLKVVLTITNGQKFMHHLFELTVHVR